MGSLHALEYRNLLGKEAGLQAHLVGNFYPPLPSKIKEDVTAAFRDYWKGKQALNKQMVMRCHLKNLDTLLQHFYDFLDLKEEETP